MNKIAYIFPGQGAQYTGMGRDVYERYRQAKDVFVKAEDILKRDIAKLCFEGPDGELTKTENSQVAIFVLSIAILCVIRSSGNGDILHPRFTAGLSLGEYSALTASGALDFEEGLKLVSLRGKFMEEASRENPGGMLAIIGLSPKDTEDICKGIDCELANLNSPNQVVVSGREEALEAARARAEELGAKRVLRLDVSGAFHSSLMEGAASRLKSVINNIDFKRPSVPVVSNVTARGASEVSEIKENLIKQVSSATRWEDSMCFMKREGVNTYFELGPGKVLKGLARKIDAGLRVETAGTVEEIEEIID